MTAPVDVKQEALRLREQAARRQSEAEQRSREFRSLVGLVSTSPLPSAHSPRRAGLRSHPEGGEGSRIRNVLQGLILCPHFAASATAASGGGHGGYEGPAGAAGRSSVSWRHQAPSHHHRCKSIRPG